MIRTTKLAAASLVALALTACGTQAAPSKAGGEVTPVTLTALSYTTNILTGDTMTQFVAAVTKRSGGAITLADGPALPAGDADGSSAVIQMVKDGKVDVAVVASRSFDLLGATSLQALNAPMMVDSPAQAATFLADPVAQKMLDGLSLTGVVGLALSYDQLRQPLGYLGPILKPTDLKGANVLARPSAATAAVLAALGATADPRNGDAAANAIQAGQVVAAETSMDRTAGPQSGPNGTASTVTGNVQLSIKANVIIVGEKVWSGLSEAQQGVLRDAAADTRIWASTQTVALAPAATAFCEQYVGDVVVASPAQLQEWRTALAPVVQSLADANPTTKEALDRLGAIVAEQPSKDLPSPCRMAGVTALPSVTAKGDQSVIAGQWRLQVDAETLREAGASSQEADNNAGAWTLVLRADGSYSYTEPYGRNCPGTYVVAGDRLSMHVTIGVVDCDGQWEFTFDRDGESMKLIPTPEFAAWWKLNTAFFANPLVRIGDAPAA